MFSFLATAALVVGMLPGAAAESPQWESSYGKALDATKSDSRPLLVVLDNPATAEAGVAPELLNPAQDATSQRELLGSYQLCRVNVTTEYGQKVAQAFKATSFPYLAVIDKSGSVILYQKAGQTNAEGWSRMLTAHKSGERSTAVSHITYKPYSNGSMMFQQPSNGVIYGSSYCPSCQRR